MVDNFEGLVSRLERAIVRLEQLHEGQGTEKGQVKSDKIESSSKDASLNQSPTRSNVESFTAFNHLYKEWEEKTQAVGNPDLTELTNLALHLFYWTDSIVSLASASKKPSNDTFGNLSKYIREKAKEIDDKFLRPRKLENHAKAVKEGIGACFWFLTDAPHSYIEGVIEPTVFHGNRVKGSKIQTEIEWIDKFFAILREFKSYTKEHFTTGLIWKGKTEADFSDLLLGKLPTQSAQETQSDSSRASFLSEISKGASITQNLKTADKKPKGQSNDPPLQPLSTTSKTQKPADKSQPVNKPPQKYKKDHWFIENFVEDRTLVIDEAEMRESVYIDNCHKCFVQVKGKVKSIMISNCSKLDLIFDTVVSTVEAVNTKNLNIQAQNHAPSIVLDKSEYVKVYLAKNLETDIVSSKVTELNISYLQDDDDFAKEFPVTEQFITKWDPNAKKFVTKPLDIFM